jgi:hypothetical protein
MTGSVEGPLAPATSLPVLTPVHDAASSASRSSPLLSTKVSNSTVSSFADVQLEINASQIHSPMGARLVVAFVELLLYLKGQVPL